MKNRKLASPDGTKFTEAYHLTQSAVDAFGRVCPNIPKVMLEVVQGIYGRYDVAAYNLFLASNESDLETKLECLQKAQLCLFFQFSSIETIVRGKGLSIGAANEVLLITKDAHADVKKWIADTQKRMSSTVRD